MIIQKIELYNFGSYEGHCSFNFENPDSFRRIVIIGGKNGAGKTTLFSAIQLCLYGYHTFGYKSPTKLYFREVKHAINNHAILSSEESAFIRIHFTNAESHGIHSYIIERHWTWPADTIAEQIYIEKNGRSLSPEETDDFETFLIHMIPPEMLKLYFFDGEKIADYFLSEQRINIRDALMILSGNDTFDIIHDNIRRILHSTSTQGTDYTAAYLSAQDDLASLKSTSVELTVAHEAAQTKLSSVEDQLHQISSQYIKQGGLTAEQVHKLQLSLKDEEEKREKINAQRKELATDILPFLIMGDLIDQVLPQIRREDEHQAYTLLSEKLSSSGLYDSWNNILENAGIRSRDGRRSTIQRLVSVLQDGDCDEVPLIFQLSSDETMQIHSVLNRVLSFDRSYFKDLQDQLDQSIRRSRRIRNNLQKSSVEHLEEYSTKVSSLEAEARIQQANLALLSKQIDLTTQQLTEKEKQIAIVRKNLESQLKRSSVNSISGNLLLLMERLQNILYSALVKKVEYDLNRKLRELIRKPDFFEEVIIDPDFTVHIIRKELIAFSDIKQIFAAGGATALVDKLGERAVAELLHATKSKKITESLLNKMENRAYRLPMEIDKDRMSSGEKQIFVMSLYYAIMQQSNNQLPFVIDTPFARIDTEHRENITDHFFMELPGQLIVLSTNEELSGSHLKSMEGKIAHVYTLEYGADQRTKVLSDSYFEV